MTETLQNSWYWLALIGVLGGTLGSALGVGCGILLVPAFVLILSIEQKAAQAMSLAVMAPMALMAALRYHFNPDIKWEWPAIAVVLPCILVGANIGSSIAAALPAPVLRRAFGIFVVIIGIRMLWKG